MKKKDGQDTFRGIREISHKDTYKELTWWVEAEDCRLVDGWESQREGVIGEEDKHNKGIIHDPLYYR